MDERDSLKQQLAEANAACAEMRKALEELVYDANSDDNPGERRDIQGRKNRV